jgi:putative oxidoreductase
MNIPGLQRTTDNKLAGSIRLLLAVLFVMTGTMKLVVPMLADAWSGQLLASGLPFYELSRWSVPVIEIFVGFVLGVGLYTRPAAVVVIGIMTVATYVHVVVDDPSLFPLQPSEPIIPLAVIAMCVYLLWRGGGSWSKDLNATESGLT